MIACLISLVIPAFAQLAVNSTYTPQQLVNNVLLGGNVQAFNIQFSGNSCQRGYFDATNTYLYTLHNMKSGVILATGCIQVAVGPNNSGSATNPSGGFWGPGDPDLSALIGGTTTYDAAILEFDFIPKGDTIKFYYIFASEEYEEYVGSSFNDVFGFFLSGPGISGPYSNNAVNIALIPGTTTPVAINNVNHLSNTAYYYNNTCCTSHPCPGGTGTCSTNPQVIQFDGYTVKLLAKYPVICGDTYHIKLAVADAGDAVLDSGVFLEEGSFTSPSISVNIQLATQDSVSLIEGCVGASINIHSTAGDTAVIHINTWGQANPSTDLTPLPDSIIVAPPTQDTSILIWAINDFIYEPPETLFVAVWTIFCKDTIADTAMVIIRDTSVIQFNAFKDTTITCPCSPVKIKGEAFGGVPPYTYTWTDGTSIYHGDSITISPCNSITVIGVSQDSCGYMSKYDTVIVSVSPPPPITFSVPDTIHVYCWGDTIFPAVSGVSGGISPYNYHWSNGATTPTISYISLMDWKLYVTVDDACPSLPGAVDSIFIKNHYQPLQILIGDTILECPKDTAQLVLVAWKGVKPYSVQWIFPDTTIYHSFNDTLILDTIFYHPESLPAIYTIKITDSCGRVYEKQRKIDVRQYPPLTINSIGDTVICRGDGIILPYEISGGAGNYQILFSNINYSIVNNSIVFKPDTPGTYKITVIDKCLFKSSYTLFIDTMDCTPHIPNVITPNNDQENDYLHIENLHHYPENKIIIYDRWGLKVFEESPYSGRWNGKTNSGKELPDGTYYYIFTYKKGNAWNNITGFVTILRSKK